MNKSLIKKLIEGYVNDAFEQESTVFLGEAEDELDLGGGDDLGADDLGDLDADLGGDDAGGDDLDLDGGDGGEGDLGGEEGEEDLEDDMGGDLGGGGGFGGGGGGDFGGDDDFGGDGDEDGAEGEEDGEEPAAEVDLPADPVQSAVNIAINMLEETGDDNQILAAVKASIQSNFSDFREAEPIITSLWATEHPILKVVARKLLLFISGR